LPYTVRFEPWGSAVECTADQSLLDAARLAEIPVGAVCSGRGACGKCQVRVLTAPPPPTQAERTTVAAGALEQGFRLACMHKADRDLTVEILPIISHGKGEAPPLERAFELAPAVRRQDVTLEPPSLDRPVDDGSNLLDALAAAGLLHVTETDYRVAQALPELLRSAEWRVAVSVRSATTAPGIEPSGGHSPRQAQPAEASIPEGRTSGIEPSGGHSPRQAQPAEGSIPEGRTSGIEPSGGHSPRQAQPAEASILTRQALALSADEIIAVRPGFTAPPPLGLAVDLGTTNIATYLYNLNDGALLGVFGAANPLASYGADILSRLIYAQRSPENGGRLQRTLVKALNLLIEHAAQTAGFTPADVEELTVVGNSGMHHLFLNLPSGQLVRAPYVPATRRPMSLKARELGIAIAPGGYVYMPPLVGGFVGSDLLAVALTTRLDRQPGVRLALDIGTNTELLLAVDGRLFSCSTASGPALEGAALRFGSVAAAGVVDRVWLNPTDGSFGYRTIRGKPAVGICGSGIVEALACMAQAGIFNASGRIQTDRSGVVAAPDGDHRFVLAPARATGLGEDLTISQHDVRAIQLAKGAIRGGMATLLAEHGLTVDDLDELLVAGAFGNHIGVESAQAIGLYPAIPRERIHQIGNAAGTGAGLMLLSTVERQAAEELSGQINYLELARHRRFTRLFAEGQRFPMTT
jgi:uncharacterized 2Fe-2S/4Fe-4S cluster protein (DUF4445 family)